MMSDFETVTVIEAKKVSYPLKRVKALYPPAIHHRIRDNWLIRWRVREVLIDGMKGLIPITHSIEGSVVVQLKNKEEVTLDIVITNNIGNKFEFKHKNAFGRAGLHLYPDSIDIVGNKTIVKWAV